MFTNGLDVIDLQTLRDMDKIREKNLMRDPNRLYKFYNDLMRIHMENFPDWRFGQLIGNFEIWLRDKKKIDDIYYVEEIHMMHFIEQFVEDMCK